MDGDIRRIRVKASKNYDVVIGNGLLKKAGNLIKEVSEAKKAVIISDDNVAPLYAGTLKRSLLLCGMDACLYVFPHGESAKCMAVYEDLLEYMSSEGLGRSDLAVALGGGVTGDLAGFAAATYQRGISFVQIPTSLLAAVDSSVGGKTAINLKGGKNQAGCFHQPDIVICDTDTLNTLPDPVYTGGLGEVIKYGMIKDASLFDELAEKPARDWIQDVILRCVTMKRDLVEGDEFDTCKRMLLNFGHTLGHAVEKISGYKIEHGYAVAMGMAAVTKASEKKGICKAGAYEKLKNLLETYGLPSQIPYSPSDVFDACMTDKKKTGDRIKIIVPERIGSCIVKDIETRELSEWI